MVCAAVLLALWSTYADRLFTPAGFGLASEEGEPTRARPGGPAPAFALAAVPPPGTLRLGDFRDQPVLLNFWATWCGPCRTEMPEFQRFQERQGSAVTVIGIDLQEDPDTVEPFLRRFGISYRIGLDTDGQVASRYIVTGLPTTVFIDRAGVVRDRAVGPLTYDDLVQRTARLP